MHSSLRSLRFVGFWLCFFGIVAISYQSGCSKPVPVDEKGKDGGSDGGTTKTCSKDGDCDTGFACLGGVCKKPCTKDTDCASNQECKSGECKDKVISKDECKTDGDCPPGKTCQDDAGKKVCKEVNDPKVDRVEIITPASVVREGVTLQFEAAAYNKSGGRLAGTHAFKWASSNSQAASIDAQSGLATGGATDGETDITAELEGKKSPPVKLGNIAKLASGKARVLVLDGDNKPVVDATVKMGDKEGKTDAKGIATVDGAAPFDLHIYHDNYAYFSAFGVQKSDLFVQLSKNPDSSKAGGVKGKFVFDKIKALLGVSEEDWAASTIGFGLAGFSIPGNLIDLNLNTFIGETFKVKLFGFETSLPSGLVVDIAGSGKAEYQTLGEPGRRIFWGLGGKFKIDEVQPLIPTDTKNVDIGKILAQAKPLFNKFVFGHVPDVNVTMLPKVKDINDKNGDGKMDDDIPDFDKFETKNLTLDTKLDKEISLSVSGVPSYKHNGKDVPFYIISAAGVRVPGYGLIPTGIGIEQATGATVSLKVKTVSRAGILATGKFVVLTIALTMPLGDNPPPTLVAGDVQFFDAIPASVTVSSFVGFGTSPKFDPATRKLTGATMTGATGHMLDISTKDGKRWVVVYGSNADITLPTPAGGKADRVSADGSASLRGIKLTGQTLDSILEFNTLNMDRLVEVIGGFSNVTVYEKPKTP